MRLAELLTGQADVAGQLGQLGAADQDDQNQKENDASIHTKDVRNHGLSVHPGGS